VAEAADEVDELDELDGADVPPQAMPPAVTPTAVNTAIAATLRLTVMVGFPSFGDCFEESSRQPPGGTANVRIR
jgi:hypothetical protein